MTQMKWVVVAALPLTSIACSAANEIVVEGIVRNQSGGMIQAAQVVIKDDNECCSDNQKPCVYHTDSNGKWTNLFVTGRADRSPPDLMVSCTYFVNKSGFRTGKAIFDYCIQGPCAGRQHVRSEIILVPDTGSSVSRKQR